MMLAMLLLLAGAATRVETVDEIFQLPASEWRYVELQLKQEPVTVLCRFEAAGSGAVRVALLPADDLARMRQEQPHGILAVTPAGPRGHIRYTVHAPGDYYVVVDNRENNARPAQVRLRVSLDFSGGEPAVRTLSPRKRAAVVVVSCLVFFGIVGFAGLSLLRGLRR